MPKVQISTLPCIERVKDGDIEIRFFGQFNTEIHYHEKAQLISPEMGTVYLYSEKDSFCIPAGHYAYISPSINHKLVSRSHNLKLKTIFIDLPDESYMSNWGAVAIFPPSSLLDNLLAFGEQYWFDSVRLQTKLDTLGWNLKETFEL